MRLQNMKIKTRFMSILVVWIIVFIVIVFVTISQINILGNSIKNINEHSLKVSNATKETRVQIIKIHRSNKDIILSRNPQELQTNIEESKLHDDEVFENLEIIRSNTTIEETKELEKEIRKLFIQWQNNRNEIIMLVQQGETDKAIELTKDKNSVIVDNLESMLIQIYNNATDQANVLTRDALELESAQARYLLITAGIIIAVFIGIFTMILRSILSPINKLKITMNNSITTGNLELVTIDGNNEIAEMSMFYNTLAKKLNDIFWIKDNKNIINQQMADNNNLEMFIQHTLSFLCRAVAGGKGVFYFYDKEREVLSLRAAYAFNYDDKQRHQFSLGEGTVGQVALEKKSILTKTTSEEGSVISTSIIDITPVNIYTFPIIYEEELYGVIEIASMEKFNDTKLQFLDEVSETVAINLHSSLLNDKIKTLLKISEEARIVADRKSQELEYTNSILNNQQELLQQQSEEIQQTNCELEEQHQILKQQSDELQKANRELEEHQKILKLQSEELQQTNLQLEEQQQLLEEQKKVLEYNGRELEKSKAELELSSKYKSEFLANMSHELRTPLNSIILLSKLLIKKGKDRLIKEDEEKITIINKSGEELLRLINDVLDLTKVEAGMMSMENIVFQSEDLVEEMNNMFSTVAKDKGLDLRLEDNIKCELYGDKHKISQIIRNFIANALKFTEQGTVIFKIEKDRDHEQGVRFSVKDSGIGISKEQKNIIFNEFQQGDGSISRKYGGTGLGLSISKKLADLIGGDVYVNSAFGVGSEFVLFIPNLIMLLKEGEWIPKELNVKHKGNVKSHENQIINYYRNSLSDNLQQISLLDGEQIGLKMTENKSKDSRANNSTVENNDKDNVQIMGDNIILVIEDDEVFSSYLKNSIEEMGFDVILASKGVEGLEYARVYRPRGILLDLGLPDINGIEVLRELKSTKELRNIPVHIVSVEQKHIRPQKIGALGYNEKPIEEDELKKIISNMVKFTEKKPKRVLLIEDSKAQQEYIKELIKDISVNIRIVDTEEAAKKELMESEYNVIILDLKLREGSGLSVCRFVSDKNIDTPVIIYTGSDLTIEQEKDIRRFTDSIVVKTANSAERLLDEVKLFLHIMDKYIKPNTLLKAKEDTSSELEGKTILIVDDDPRNVYTLASTLEENGATIVEADNGKIAMGKLKRQKIDLILMDIMMPEMDGYEAMELIRKDDKLKHIPIIAITAKSLKDDRKKCIKAGANDYISKPVDYDNLIILVKAWISKV